MTIAKKIDETSFGMEPHHWPLIERQEIGSLRIDFLILFPYNGYSNLGDT